MSGLASSGSKSPCGHRRFLPVALREGASGPVRLPVSNGSTAPLTLKLSSRIHMNKSYLLAAVIAAAALTACGKKEEAAAPAPAAKPAAAAPAPSAMPAADAASAAAAAAAASK